MLESIKSIINKKEEFLESAQIIYEDAIDDIENYITSNDNQPVVESNESGDDPTKTEDTTPEPAKDNDGKDNDDDIKDDDKDDLDIMSTDINNPDALTPQSTDIFDTKLNDIVDSKDDDSDIFNVSIDIKTNTLTDILPVPPMNAGDAVADDIMNTNIGDGFSETPAVELGEEFDEKAVLALSDKELEDLIRDNYDKGKSPIKDIQRKLINGEKLTGREAAIFRMNYKPDADSKQPSAGYILMQNYKGQKLSSKIFTEAISIDAAADDTKPADDKSTTDEKPADTNSVTDAVIDKVNDVESTPAPVEEDDARDKLLDKLDKLNKSVLDLKENIKKHIS